MGRKIETDLSSDIQMPNVPILLKLVASLNKSKTGGTGTWSLAS